MDPDRKRTSPWLSVLVALCVSLAAVTILLDDHDGPRLAPGSVAVAPTGADPQPARTRAAATSAHRTSPRRGHESAARPEHRAPGPKPAKSHEKPYVTVQRGAKVAIRDAPAGEVVAREDDETEFGSDTVFSVDRVRGDWLGVSTPELPNGRLGWLRADPERLAGGSTDFRVVVDLSRHSARLWRGEELLREWTVTVGAPATPTPTGRFSVTDVFRGNLNPVYGCCAVAITATQPDLPEGWSGGDRIAFHGTTGPLGVDASTGCIRSRDGDVRALIEAVPLGTPVTIRD